MRIEFGIIETSNFINSLNKVNNDINDSIGSLRKTINYMNAASGNGVYLDTSGVSKRIREENEKSQKVVALTKKVETFATNTIFTDNKVANSIGTAFETFLNKNDWAKPIVSGEKNWWEKAIDGWNDFWGGVGDWFSDAVDGVINWVKDHALEIVIGVVAITVGAAILVLSGGTAAPFMAVFLEGLEFAGISALTGGLFNAGVALFTGEDPLKAFGDGLASGFMWGGIFFAIGSTFTALRGMYKNGSMKSAKVNSTKGVSSNSGINKVDGINSTNSASQNIGNTTKYNAVEYKGTVKVNGEVRDVSRKVYQRSDIDFYLFDETTGLTNLERMQAGKPPIGPDGNAVQLHHMLQTEPGPMVELQEVTHQQYYKQLHGLAENGASFRNNPVLNKQYNNFRSSYWKWRASQFLGG